MNIKYLLMKMYEILEDYMWQDEKYWSIECCQKINNFLYRCTSASVAFFYCMYHPHIDVELKKCVFKNGSIDFFCFFLQGFAIYCFGEDKTKNRILTHKQSFFVASYNINCRDFLSLTLLCTCHDYSYGRHGNNGVDKTFTYIPYAHTMYTRKYFKVLKFVVLPQNHLFCCYF